MLNHIKRNFDKAAGTFDEAAFLFEKTNQEMMQRLKVISFKPLNILDCGAATGMSSQALLNNFKKAKVVSFDLSNNMLHAAKKKKRWLQKNSFVQGDAAKLPFATNSFDFVYSNLMLHWSSNTEHIFSEWQRVLKPNGLLMFTVLGPDTFKEIHQALHHINADHHYLHFIDMHNLGDALIKNQLLDPIMDVENFQINYSSLEKMLHELRAVGGRNLHPLRNKNLLGKKFLTQLMLQLSQFKTATNKFPLSVEIIYGHAWAGDTKVNVRRNNEIHIPLFSVKK